MTDKSFVPERIYVPTKLNGALKVDKFFETPIDGVEFIRKKAIVDIVWNFVYTRYNAGGEIMLDDEKDFKELLSKIL